MSIEAYVAEKGEEDESRKQLTSDVRAILQDAKNLVSDNDGKLTVNVNKTTYDGLKAKLDAVSSKQVSSYPELKDVYTKLLAVISDPSAVEKTLREKEVSSKMQDSIRRQELLGRGLTVTIK